jgi:hypothetical protein
MKPKLQKARNEYSSEIAWELPGTLQYLEQWYGKVQNK